MGTIKKNWGLITTIILSFIAIKPLFYSGYFPIHDSLQVERIYQMSEALRDGHFPVRWVKDLGYGYGYPLFNFYAPLPYYVGAVFKILGFSLIASAKIMFGIGIVLAGISMYFFGKKIWGTWGGILSAILYQYLPYHAVQIYVRGSVGEYWAYSFVPLLALSLLELKDRNIKRNELHITLNNRWVIIGAFSYSGIILSHNISALIVTGGLLFFIGAQILIALFREKSQWSTVKSQLLVLVFGLGLSAFFWLPAFVEKDITQVDKIIQGGSYYADHFVEPLQLWSSPWGYAGSAPPGEIDGMSFKLGKVHIILAILTTAVLLWRRRRRRERCLLLITNYSLLIFSIFMMFSISRPVYESIQILQYIQFPWRFLMFAGFSLSILGGGAMFILKKYSGWIKSGFVLFITFLVIVNIRALPKKLEIVNFKPERYFYADNSDFINDYNLKWTASKRSDEYLFKSFVPPTQKSQIAIVRLPQKEALNLQVAQNKTHVLAFLSKFDQKKEVLINIGFFPGWKAYIDKVEEGIEILDRGFLLEIPKGKHKVMIRFEDTAVRKVGNLISASTVVLLLLITFSKFNICSNGNSKS